LFETPLGRFPGRGNTGPTFLASAERAGIAWQFNAWGQKYHPFENDQAFAAHVLEHVRARSVGRPSSAKAAPFMSMVKGR